MKIYQQTLQTPLCTFSLISNESHLIATSFNSIDISRLSKQRQEKLELEEGEPSPLTQAIIALTRYFEKDPSLLTQVPINPKGTPFQEEVWSALCTIPYGQTVSYGAIAQQIGNPKSVRAVGMANNKNPIVLFIPCHRVIGANGQLIGFGGGLTLKDKLLAQENPTQKTLF